MRTTSRKRVIFSAGGRDARDRGERKVRDDIDLVPFASINSVFERLEEGKVAGRVVLDVAKVRDGRNKGPAERAPVPA